MDNVGLVSGFLAAIILAAAGAAVLCLTRANRATLRPQLGLFALAFLLRYLMALFIYIGGLIDVIKDEDGSGWLVGIAYKQLWESQDLGALQLPGAFLNAYSEQNRGYFYLLGMLFYFTENARLPAAALNCLFGALTVVFTYRVAIALFSASVARRVGLWLCFFPSMLLWSAQTIKEPVVIFLEVVSVYGCVRLRQAGFSFRHLALCVVCILLVIPFRFYAAYVMVVAIVLALAVPRIGRGKVKFSPALGGLMVCAILACTGFLAGREREVEQFDLKYLENFRKDASQGGSGVPMDVDLTTTSGLLTLLAVGSAHLLLAPFPWQLMGGGMRTALVAPEMVFYWWLFFWGLVPGLVFAVRNRFHDALPIFIFLVGFGMLYSLMFSNVGLVYRQRAQLFPWLAICAGVGIERRMLRRGLKPRVPPPSPPVAGNPALLLGARPWGSVPGPGGTAGDARGGPCPADLPRRPWPASRRDDVDALDL